jgi:serine phosphatase RsbU (regulator of sigma subunit)
MVMPKADGPFPEVSMPRKRLFEPLIQLKVFGVVAALTIGLVGLLAVYFSIRHVAAAHRAIERKALTYGRLVGIQVEPAVTFDDEEAAAEVFSATATDEDIRGLALFDAQGKSILARGVFSPPLVSPVALVTASRLLVTTGGTRCIAPVLSKEGFRGTLVLELSTDSVAIERSRTQRDAVGIGCIALLLGFLGALGIGRSLAKRLAAIAVVTRAVADGDLSQKPIVVTSRDEVGQLARSFNAMLANIQTLVRDVADKSRMESELSVARIIQTSLIPRDVNLVDLDIAACMLPATEVGGDYYDLIPTPDGGWICIGDVVGHGLTAGLSMVMLQSGISALLRERPEMRPRDVIRTVNAMFFENARRLGKSRYATLVVARYTKPGRLDFAGGHVDFLLKRNAESAARFVPTPGSFVGLEERLEASAIEESALELQPDDLLVMYTDGLTEARNAEGALYGGARLALALDTGPQSSVAQIRDHLIADVRRFTSQQSDDISLIVLRHRSGAQPDLAGLHVPNLS